MAMKNPRELVGGFPMGKRWAVEIIADILPPSCADKIRPSPHRTFGRHSLPGTLAVQRIAASVHVPRPGGL